MNLDLYDGPKMLCHVHDLCPAEASLTRSQSAIMAHKAVKTFYVNRGNIAWLLSFGHAVETVIAKQRLRLANLAEIQCRSIVSSNASYLFPEGRTLPVQVPNPTLPQPLPSSACAWNSTSSPSWRNVRTMASSVELPDCARYGFAPYRVASRRQPSSSSVVPESVPVPMRSPVRIGHPPTV